MKKKAIIIIIFLLLLLNCYSNKKISFYFSKDCHIMKKAEIFPQVLSSNQTLMYISNINIENSFVGLNYRSEFCLCKIDSGGHVDVTPVVSGFPGEPGRNFGSENNSSLVWMSSGRALFTMDVSDRRKKETLLSVSGDQGICRIKLVDAVKKKLIVKIDEAGWGPADYKLFHLLYDFNESKIEYRSDNIVGGNWPLSDNKILFRETTDSNKNQWYFTDAKRTVKVENELTKKMTEKQNQFCRISKPISAIKNTMLGTTVLDDDVIFNKINWNDSFEDVDIIPLIIQFPKELGITNNFKFSYDGNWVKTNGTIDRGDDLTYPDNIIFYSVDTIYPNGISLPVIGGPTNEINPYDVFINHTELGPIYINLYKGVLLSYKMVDVVQVLKNKMLDI